MALLRRVRNKLVRSRYKLLEKRLFRAIDLGSAFDGNSKYLFLYFDYEREYSGHKTDITDTDVEEIVKLLARYQFVSTWFIVGQVMEKYPDSVRNIQSYGNEIGSHTYSHLILREATLTQIKKDFSAFDSPKFKDLNIKGFHSPRDQWDVRALSCYANYGYKYDLLKTGLMDSPITFRFPPKNRLDSMVRFSSVIDDWDLFHTELEPEDVTRYFSKALDVFQAGTIAGIGFHPWLLVSDRNIWEGFVGFIKLLSTRKDITIKTCGQYAEILTGNL
ncbi:MAG: hypothetical protein CVU49_00130 [Candidatus Cloacimonetes bacterium HGW-Cloacimonetes-2]|nr:MAG: hypothetical protein CVU49_00130 [Candidatus Cloacimonetes bacterium HGW-Cloacimonetes-2]